jgi:cytochrome P450
MEASDPRGLIFIQPSAYADQEHWHAVAAELRRDAPVLKVEAADFAPFWAVTRHEDVFFVSRNNDRFLNTRKSMLIPEFAEQLLADAGVEAATLVHMDGEEHRGHRDVTNAYFRPSAVSRRQMSIDRIADEYVDRFRDLGGSCDFAQDIAVPFTLRVIMSIFGVAQEDEPTMLKLTQGIFGAGDPEYVDEFSSPTELFVESLRDIDAFFDEITADRRRTPADDLATVIANAEVSGCPMSHNASLWYYIIVATAGHDTTSFALAGGLEALLRDQDQLAMLRAAPGLRNNAVEEMIRWTSPVRAFLRYPTQDVTIGDVEVSAGDRLLLSYPSANRDETVFDDAMRFSVSRPNANRMIAFGGGEHFCLGSSFARRELRTMLPKLLDAVDTFELDGDPQWSLANFVGGVKHLPVRATFR